MLRGYQFGAIKSFQINSSDLTLGVVAMRNVSLTMKCEREEEKVRECPI